MARQPVVIDHEPRKIFTVTITFKSGDVEVLDNVTATVTGHRGTPTEDPLVPYNDYMIVQQVNLNSTYVNMREVQHLTVGEQTDG